MQRTLAAFAATAAAALLAAAPASGHDGHKSCRAFGENAKTLSQQPGPFGEQVRVVAQAGGINEFVATAHQISCQH